MDGLAPVANGDGGGDVLPLFHALFKLGWRQGLPRHMAYVVQPQPLVEFGFRALEFVALAVAVQIGAQFNALAKIFGCVRLVFVGFQPLNQFIVGFNDLLNRRVVLVIHQFRLTDFKVFNHGLSQFFVHCFSLSWKYSRSIDASHFDGSAVRANLRAVHLIPKPIDLKAIPAKILKRAAARWPKP